MLTLLPVLLTLAQEPCTQEPCATTGDGASELLEEKVPESARQIGDAPVVLGALSVDQVQHVVVAEMEAIQRCYERALTRDPSLKGRVVLKLVIEASGEVSRAELAEDEIDDIQMTDCVLGVVRGLRFPPPEEGGVVVVSYPIRFEGSAAGLEAELESIGGLLGAKGVAFSTGDAEAQGALGPLGSAPPSDLVLLDAPQITGSLTAEQVESVVRRHMNQVTYCYQRELTRNPELAGAMTVDFSVGADGRVLQAEAVESSLGNGAVERCVSGRFVRFVFPAPEDGGVVKVLMGMRFQPG